MIAPGPALFAAANRPPEGVAAPLSSRLDAAPFAYSREIQSGCWVAPLAFGVAREGVAIEQVATVFDEQRERGGSAARVPNRPG
jgi:hypothetical protein